MKRWVVVFVVSLYDRGIEIERTWTERGAWRVIARQLNTPNLGWYEVRHVSELQVSGVDTLDAELRKLTGAPRLPQAGDIVHFDWSDKPEGER